MAPSAVAGRVVDAAGRPVAGARVAFTASPGPVPDVAQLTGPDGRFAITAPQSGRYRVAVNAAGHAAAERELELGTRPPAPIEIVLGAATC